MQTPTHKILNKCYNVVNCSLDILMASAGNQVTGNDWILSDTQRPSSELRWRRNEDRRGQAGQRIQLALLIKVTLCHARCQDSFELCKPPEYLFSW